MVNPFLLHSICTKLQRFTHCSGGTVHEHTDVFSKSSEAAAICGLYAQPEGDMRGYHYNFLDRQGVVDRTLVLPSASDETACELASDLLSRSESSLSRSEEARSSSFKSGGPLRTRIRAA